MAVVLEDDSSHPVSERVQSLAKSLYDELEGLISVYGPDSVGNLMPLVVNILESLDSALSDNQDHLNAVMELTEENQQLVSNYEREKQHRREIEEKAILMEDANEREIATLKDRNAVLGLENKSLHNKLNSQTEQTDKLDERHEQLKLEYKDLHQKNLELIRNLHGRKDTIKDAGSFLSAVRIHEEGALSSDAAVVPGFQDFTESKQRKKRQQPSIPIKPREQLLSLEDESFIGNTPAVHRIDSPEFDQGQQNLPSYVTDLADEINEREEDETEDIMDQQGFMVNPDEEVPVNEQSLFAEMGDSNTFEFSGLDDILLENKQLHNEKENMSKKLEDLSRKIIEIEMNKKDLVIEKDDLTQRLTAAIDEVKKLKKDVHDNKEELRQLNDQKSGQSTASEGLRISRLEIAKVLRERNEWKEKYFSLLEQVRMNDELYLFKRKDRKSRWVDYFTALFSSTRRRQLEQSLIESSPHRPILAPGTASSGDGGDVLSQEQLPLYDGAGYAKTKVIPTLKRVGKKEDEIYLTSVSWVIPNMPDSSPAGSPVAPPVHASPNINTCRPMSFQEEGAKILCATAINKASFLSDCSDALSIPKNTEFSSSEDSSMSLVWICTGTDTLTKVSVLDTAAVGEVLETFAVCSTPIVCMSAVPSFDDKDPDVLSSLSTKVKKTAGQPSSHERPSSQYATIWMGAESGVLYVHSALMQWKKCLHADKLAAGIQGIVHSKGKVFLLLQNATLAVFMRFSDGEWDWDNYEVVSIAQKKNLPVTAIASVKYNIWCAIGNTIHVLHSHSLRTEATFTVHAWKNAEVRQLLTVGDGVWVAFKCDSVLRLFNATSFTHMQDLDVAPSVHKILVFGSEKVSNLMPVHVSCVIAAQNSLWVGTDNGIIMNFPFSRPTIVAEESGWEVIKEAEVSGQSVPEPFDVRTEEAIDESAVLEPQLTTAVCKNTDAPGGKQVPQPFNPFISIDQVQLSIHCHVNSVKSLVCVPGLVPSDITVFEPLGGVYIGPGERADYKPSLFVMSCGEGHLDLRTADKVMQTVHAQESGKPGVPSAASIISEKNYIMVWDVLV